MASRERDMSVWHARSHARTAVSDLIHDVPVITAPRQRHVCSKPPAVEGLPQARSCACGELRAKCCLEANFLRTEVVQIPQIASTPRRSLALGLAWPLSVMHVA